MAKGPKDARSRMRMHGDSKRMGSREFIFLQDTLLQEWRCSEDLVQKEKLPLILYHSKNFPPLTNSIISREICAYSSNKKKKVCNDV